MKNIINYDIDFSKIDVSVKKYLYIHNDIYRWMEINIESNKEKLVKISNSEILCEPFWNDELLLTWNKEIDDLINLEEIEMKKYLKNNPNFWIFVRETVKKKILNINNNLKNKGYYLSLKIWYRPLEVQKKLFNTIFQYFENKYKEDKNPQEIYDETIQMISDPSKNFSPHVTGWAVDVVLYNKSWKIVDMWCPVNFIWEKSYLTTTDITEKQKENRNILTDNFLEWGFSCLCSEWWHFSYWDPYWAKFYWKKEALYWMI